jgi:SNF2 family DNA or RNA helicase
MKLLAKPYKFQLEGIEFALNTPYSLNAFEMGLGKSLVSIATAVKASVGKCLVIAPAFLIPNWREEIEKFTGEKAEDTMFGSPARFYLCSYSSLKKVEKYFDQFNMVVCDEVHYAKNLKAKRTQLLHQLISTHKPERFIGLSGTPIKNRVPEFYSLLRLCAYGGRYHEFSKYMSSDWRFCMDFTNKRTKFVGSRKFTEFEGVKNADVLKKLIQPVYLRKRAKDVLDLPKQVTKEMLMSDRSKTDGLLEMAFEAYEGKKKSKSFASGKAISALGKVPYTVEFVKDTIEEAEKYVIFTDHRQAAKKLFDELEPLGARYVLGDTPAEKRQSYANMLNRGEINILIATTGSLSVGVNLTGCNRMIFNDMPWVPTDIDQAEKRIHRIGQTETCFYYYILASKYDQYILRTLQKKRKILREVGQ